MKKFALLFVLASFSSFACEHNTLVKSISVSKKWTLFKFESGLELRLAHEAAMTPALYNASLMNQKVCLTQVTGSSSGGIPNQVMIKNEI